jgi:hypothetical protein
LLLKTHRSGSLPPRKVLAGFVVGCSTFYRFVYTLDKYLVPLLLVAKGDSEDRTVHIFDSNKSIPNSRQQFRSRPGSLYQGIPRSHALP